MSKLFYPYKRIEGDLVLTVMSVDIDEKDPAPEVLTAEAIEQRQITLWDQEKTKWKTVRLRAELLGPTEELRRHPAGESITATLIIRCTSTWERRAVAMQKVNGPDAKWVADVELQRDDFFGTTFLSASLSGPIVDVNGRPLCSSEAWRLHFDQPAIDSKTGAIAVKWADFSNDDRLFLKEYANEPFFADFESGSPTLYLNKGGVFDRLPTLLTDRPRKGADLVVHNAERVGIARAVWLAMLHASIAGIRKSEENAEPDWPESEWQTRVLKSVLPRIFNQEPVEALKSAYEDWHMGGVRVIESRGQVEINKRIQATRWLKGTLAYFRDDAPSEVI